MCIRDRLQIADKVIIELNDQIPESIKGLHDIHVPLDPPYRKEIPIYTAHDRAGAPVAHVDPKKVLGVVKTSMPLGKEEKFTPVDEQTAMIGKNVCNFLISEMKNGKMPKTFLPIQSGVGNIANAVLGSDARQRAEVAQERPMQICQHLLADPFQRSNGRPLCQHRHLARQDFDAPIRNQQQPRSDSPHWRGVDEHCH